MGLLIDGNQVKSSGPMGEDERRLLDALHGRGAFGERLKKDLEKNRELAPYKIEVQFMKARSSKRETSNLAAIMVWESGRRFHGGGDQRMVFCGYWRGQGYQGEDECMMPVKDENFVRGYMVCPYCQREQFLNEKVKMGHIKLAREDRSDVSGLKKMPIANGKLLMNLSPKRMADFMSRIWHDLEGKADLYIKFHPTDIRCHDVPEIRKPDVYERARRDRTEKKENKGFLVYPLENIIKDTVAGATIGSRFLSCILA